MSLQFDDIRRALIGEGTAIPGPFGPRALIYADYVASGRALGFVEDAIRQHVLPYYGNTHTETSFTGRRTTELRELARASVREGMGADDGHAVVFCGAGSTAATDKLVRALQMGVPAGRLGPDAVVFVGPYEHHSNDLPWRESGAKLVRIPLDAAGTLCLETLGREIAAHAGAGLILGAFSAASNVTGIRTDIGAVARLLHEAGGWCVIDFAAAAPYVAIRLAESAPGAGDRIDAALISPHKFPGGPGASGLLIADCALLAAARPTVVGGGTVSFVSAAGQCYIDGVEAREEAGTPSIVGNIRAGMVMALKTELGAEAIETREGELRARLDAALSAEPGIELLGPRNAPRLGIFSFNIRIGARHLHHGFVVAVLNDLFGIQARGGCSCAGPYGHHLLQIDDDRSQRFSEAVARGHTAFRPGWVRLGVNYFFSDEDVDRLARALVFIARNGLALLPLYRLDVEHGVWRALDGARSPAPESLAALWAETPDTPEPPDFDTCLAEAARLAETGRARAYAVAGTPLHPEDEALRWFWLPEEAAAALTDEETPA
ncbi:aminotransferase class V-fold PLP-dependent enzyme [Rhodovulum sulfidophilum]|uniref:aminotransferase class V-fold PLP-dependent enzyme n=1 Tax=Rhodovulum sulfidophilum TaxID=35806 RepID=UPI0019250778|nr:aminotransferase class V-fold PLP-dependent enzyme [Rhodovulum sulfidophilum]MBL3596942.1 aminotransferase class V-fold PLP-dependent enzyme [Rhodovulum sulfidophilum]